MKTTLDTGSCMWLLNTSSMPLAAEPLKLWKVLKEYTVCFL